MNILDLALPYQRKFILAPQRKKIWVSSRQIGKSWTLAFIATYKALEKKNGLSLCISTGGRAAQELIKKVHQFAEAVKLITKGRIDYMPSSDGCKFSNGSRVVSLPSGNPTALRGWSANGAVLIDECAFIERPYEVMQAIAPTLTRFKDAQLIVASSPAGKQGLFWDLYNEQDEGTYVQTTTIEDAIADGLAVDIEELKKLCPDPLMWKMEYEAQFADEFGAFIDPTLLQFDNVEDKSNERYVGFDVARSSDNSAIVDVQKMGDKFYVADILLLHNQKYETQLEIFKQQYTQKKWSSGYVDAVGLGSPIAEFIHDRVSARIKPFVWNETNKSNAYEYLRSLILDHKITFSPHLEQMVKIDFQNVSRIVTENGKVKFVAQHNSQGHSDITSALVLALWSAHDNPASFAMPQTYMMPTAFGSYGSRLS